MSMVSQRGGGIAKRRGGPRVRVDQDGDLDMDNPSGRGGGRGRGGGGRRGRGTVNLNRAPRGPAADNKRNGGAGGGSLASRVRDPKRDPIGTRSHTRNAPRPSYSGPMVGVKVEGWKLSRGSADECALFLERKSKLQFIKTRKDGDTLIVYVPVNKVQTVLDWDNALFAGANLRITSDLTQAVENAVVEQATPKGGETSKTIEALKKVLDSRYNANTKLLDLSALAADPILRDQGFFDLHSTTNKMFPALIKIANDLMENNPQKKREFVVSVSLANNGIRHVGTLSSLSASFPDIKNLSLENNAIADWKGLENWKHRFRSLEQLILIGNPITQMPGYKEEIMRRYPALTMLDNVTLDRPVPKVGGDEPRRHTRSNAISGSTALLAQSNKPIPLPVRGNLVTDPALLERFLSTFFPLYDTNRDRLLSIYYTPETYFSMSLNVSARRVQSQQNERQHWDTHIQLSRNLTRINQQKKIERLARGPDEARELWKQLPPTRHDITKQELWCYDSWPTEIAPGVPGMIICVHGECDEDVQGKVLKRSFDRTFLLRPGGPDGVQIVNEQLLLRAYGGYEAWRVEDAQPNGAPGPSTTTANGPGVKGMPSGAAGEDAEKQQKAMMLAEKSGLTVEYAAMCLNETGWDLAMAWEAFQTAKDNGRLGPEAFAR